MYNPFKYMYNAEKSILDFCLFYILLNFAKINKKYVKIKKKYKFVHYQSDNFFLKPMVCYCIKIILD